MSRLILVLLALPLIADGKKRRRDDSADDMRLVTWCFSMSERAYGGYLSKLEPLGDGILELNTNPPGATVSIDGKQQRHKTPLQQMLRPGPHRVTLRLGEVTHELTVHIDPELAVIETRDLRPSQEPPQ